MPYCAQCLAGKQAWVGLAFAGFHKKNLSNKKRPLGLSLELKPEKLFSLVELRTKTLQNILIIQKRQTYTRILLTQPFYSAQLESV